MKNIFLNLILIFFFCYLNSFAQNLPNEIHFSHDGRRLITGNLPYIVFSWRNDATTGTQPPASADNIIINYNTTGNNPYNYSWNTFPIQSTSTANNLSAGSYLVTVTDASTCTRRDII